MILCEDLSEECFATVLCWWRRWSPPPKMSLSREEKMQRRTFVNRLRALGEIQIPEGHARVNKGITTYFFGQDQKVDVNCLLEECGLTPQQPVKPFYRPTTQWVQKEADGFVSHDVMVASDEENLFVSIVRWQD